MTQAGGREDRRPYQGRVGQRLWSATGPGAGRKGGGGFARMRAGPDAFGPGVGGTARGRGNDGVGCRECRSGTQTVGNRRGSYPVRGRGGERSHDDRSEGAGEGAPDGGGGGAPRGTKRKDRGPGVKCRTKHWGVTDCIEGGGPDKCPQGSPRAWHAPRGAGWVAVFASLVHRLPPPLLVLPGFRQRRLSLRRLGQVVGGFRQQDGPLGSSRSVPSDHFFL